VLECLTFAIQEHDKILSAVQSYDIRDGATGEVVGSARERIGGFTRALRWVLGKHLLPTAVEVTEKPDDSLVFSLRRGGYLLRSRVEVRDAVGQLVGFFASKSFTISDGFQVYAKDGKVFAQVKGRLFGSDYRFLAEDGKVELGQVSKRLGGLVRAGREVQFSADNYFLTVNPDLTEQPIAKMLLLATTLAIDLIYKSESSGGHEPSGADQQRSRPC
jgi:uncharacterized protein YxjI